MPKAGGSCGASSAAPTKWRSGRLRRPGAGRRAAVIRSWLLRVVPWVGPALLRLRQYHRAPEPVAALRRPGARHCPAALSTTARSALAGAAPVLHTGGFPDRRITRLVVLSSSAG